MAKRKRGPAGLLTGPLKMVVGVGMIASGTVAEVSRVAARAATRKPSPKQKRAHGTVVAARAPREPGERPRRAAGTGRQTKEQRIRAQIETWTEEDAALSGLPEMPDPDRVWAPPVVKRKVVEDRRVRLRWQGDGDELTELLRVNLEGKQVFYFVALIPVYPIILQLELVVLLARWVWYFWMRYLATVRWLLQELRRETTGAPSETEGEDEEGS